MHRLIVIVLALFLFPACGIYAESQGSLSSLLSLLKHSESESLHRDILLGMVQGLEGRRHVEMPTGWTTVSQKMQQSSSAEVRDLVIRIALLFDDPEAIQLLRERAIQVTIASSVRRRAIELLIAKAEHDFDESLIQLVADTNVQRAAIRGLAAYDHPQTVSSLLKHYSRFDSVTQQDALQTLASKPKWAEKLVEAIDAKQIKATDLNAFTVRPLHRLGSDTITSSIKRLWGDVRTTSASKTRRIEKLKEELTEDVLAKADLSAGRILFTNTCASCHKLFGEGKEIGPDLTGSQRTNLDYVLQNLVDPSGAVSKDYQMQIVITTGGRVITGLVMSETNQTITIQTANERVVLPASEIEQRTRSSVSMMPEGQLLKLSRNEVRDLIGYLGSRVQVSLPNN